MENALRKPVMMDYTCFNLVKIAHYIVTSTLKRNTPLHMLIEATLKSAMSIELLELLRRRLVSPAVPLKMDTSFGKIRTVEFLLDYVDLYS